MHSALLLAAGASQRLGRPKQLLRYRDNGETLVQRMARLAIESGAAEVIVVTGAYRQQVFTKALLADAAATGVVRECYNADYALGMARTLRAGIGARAHHAAPLLILSCDQVMLTHTHIYALLSGAQHSASRSAACRFYDGRLGIPAVIGPALLRELQSATLQSDQGFRTLLQQHQATVFSLMAPELAVDIDTPSDLVQAVALGVLLD
jgi:molybdenum cofactor cytidylyltransferase